MKIISQRTCNLAWKEGVRNAESLGTTTAQGEGETGRGGLSEVTKLIIMFGYLT